MQYFQKLFIVHHESYSFLIAAREAAYLVRFYCTTFSCENKRGDLCRNGHCDRVADRYGCILFIVLSAWLQSKKNSRKTKVTARVVSSSGNTLYSGHGNTVGSAVSDSFYKMYSGLSASSREETIKSRLDNMKSTLSDNRWRMNASEVAQCEYYISRTHDLLMLKENERIKRNQEIESLRREKEKDLSARQKYIAAQRRLMTASMRYDVLQRDNFRCVLCGATAADGVTLHVDHILPLAKGGKTEMSNLRTLCDRCNLGKGAKIETIALQADDKNVYPDIQSVMQALRDAGIEYEFVDAGGTYAIKCSPVIDGFMSNINVADGELQKSMFYDTPVWTIAPAI